MERKHQCDRLGRHLPTCSDAAMENISSKFVPLNSTSHNAIANTYIMQRTLFFYEAVCFTFRRLYFIVRCKNLLTSSEWISDLGDGFKRMRAGEASIFFTILFLFSDVAVRVFYVFED